jgi:hypothetical protein
VKANIDAITAEKSALSPHFLFFAMASIQTFSETLNIQDDGMGRMFHGVSA